MLTIPEEEITPKLNEYFGAVGRIVKDENGDATGTVVWGLAASEKEFEKAHESPNFKTIRVKRMPELITLLRKRQRAKSPGSTSIIEVPEVPEKEFRGWGDIDRRPKILELNTPHYRTLGTAIRYLRQSKATKAWIYKAGSDAPVRDWSNISIGGNGTPGIFPPGSINNGAMMKKLIPEEFRVIRGIEDVTEAAIDNNKNTIPLKGGMGLRRANEKGMGQTAFMLVPLTPENFRRAVLAATYQHSDPKTGQQVVYAPRIYKYDLQRLVYSISNLIKKELQSHEGRNRMWFEITFCEHTVDDLISTLPVAFETAFKIKGLEQKMWHRKFIDYSETHGFVSDILTIWKARECYQKWMAAGKYNGMERLWPYLETFGKRCTREKATQEREKKQYSAKKAAEAEERKKQNHVSENSPEGATTEEGDSHQGGQETDQSEGGPEPT